MKKKTASITIPDKIKIGGHYFDIVYMNERDDQFTKSGNKHSWYNRIIIQDEMCMSKKISTLIHEILHEICWQNEIDISEGNISCIAECLYQVMVDNIGGIK